MRALLTRLSSLQLRKPGLLLIIAVLLTAASVPFIMQLRIDGRLIALLPDSRPSVQDLDEVKARLRGLATLTVAVESPSKNVEGMRKLIRELERRLNEHSEVVGQVDADVLEYRNFIEHNRHLFAPLETLRELRDALDHEVTSKKLAANPFYIDLEKDGESDLPDLQTVLDKLRATQEKGSGDSFPDGFYQHSDNDLIVLFSRSDVSQGGGGVPLLISTVQGVVDSVDLKAYGDDLTVTLAGDVIIGGEEAAAIAQELIIATVLTFAGVMLVIVIFFRRWRAIPLLAMGVVPGLAMSFAYATMSVGKLNISSAFLGSVILGNGVNPSIIWLARYFEERRQGKSVEEALPGTHQAVWIATAAASGAAGLAYASLSITDFRGFRDFGIIGGVGMALCWTCGVVFMPAAVAWSEKRYPLRFPAQTGTERAGPAQWLVSMARARPGGVVLASLVLTAASGSAIYGAIQEGPVEYDFRKLRSERDPSESVARTINGRVNSFMSSASQGRGIVMLADQPDDLPLLKAQLEKTKGKVHSGYRSIDDLLPEDMPKKLRILGDIEDLVEEVQPHLSEEQRKEVEEQRPPADLRVLTLADLPEQISGRFTEADGRQGLILVVSEAEHRSTWDGRYLIEWAGTLRELHLKDGDPPVLAGMAPVFADVIDAVYTDMPKAIGAAFAATFVVALIAFTLLWDRVLAVASLLLGILWMAGMMAALGMKLHFLNFVAFPITFGNGVDYTLNVLRRYRTEKDSGKSDDPVRAAVINSGGAVMLCSLTTIIGYSTLYVSANLAMNSFGLAMAISEITCVAAAVVTVPAVLYLAQRRAAAA